MTCKIEKQLFILDLDAATYSVSSTVSGAFDGEPDQIMRLLDSNSDILYFQEDVGSSAGVHVRDSNGKYYTILQGELGLTDGETTGVAFSPGNKFMYVAFQQAGKLFEISRADGKPFSAQPLDIKYHDDPNNNHPFATL
jgi:secreted PhoX family phosphatase